MPCTRRRRSPPPRPSRPSRLPRRQVPAAALEGEGAPFVETHAEEVAAAIGHAQAKIAELQSNNPVPT